MKLDDKKTNLNLLQEECAELIQAASKVRRFGIDAINPVDNVPNRDNLIQEIQDVQVFIEAVLKDYGVTEKEKTKAWMHKMKRLRVWYGK